MGKLFCNASFQNYFVPCHDKTKEVGQYNYVVMIDEWHIKFRVGGNNYDDRSDVVLKYTCIY